MSDYDTVLERLLTDPTFSSALSADPDRALAGYTLTDDERRTLAAGISTDAGRTSTVEQRTTKAGLVGVAGLVAELAGAMGGSGSDGVFGDADGTGVRNFVDSTPHGSAGDVTIVEFTQGAIHEPFVVGQLYGDHTAPPTEANNPLFSTTPMPTADQPVVENVSPQEPGQGLGQGQEPGDDEGRGHSDKSDPARSDDPPPPQR